MTTSTNAIKATAINLARLADRNLFHIAHQANHEIERASTRDDEVAIAHIGIAICRARAIIREAIDAIEGGRR